MIILFSHYFVSYHEHFVSDIKKENCYADQEMRFKNTYFIFMFGQNWFM